MEYYRLIDFFNGAEVLGFCELVDGFVNQVGL